MDKIRELKASIPKLEGDEKSKTLCDLGVALHKVNPEESISYFVKSLKIAKKLGNKQRIARCYSGLGNVHWLLSDYNTSMDYLLKSLQIYNDLGNNKARARVFNTLGSVCVSQGLEEQALKYFLQAKELNEELEDETSIGTIYCNIGVLYKRMGKLDEAMMYYLDSLDIRERINDIRGISAVYANIGQLLSTQEKYSQSLEYYSKALELKEKINDRYGIALSYNNIGNIYIKLGEYENAINILYKSLKLCAEIGAKGLEMNCYLYLSDLYEQQGDTKQALNYYKAHHMVEKELFNEEKTKQMTKLQSNFDIISKEKEAEIFKLKNIELIEKNREITRQKEKLERLNDELLKSNSERENFLSIIAHDLKNPISIFIGLTDLLSMQDNNLPPDQYRNYLNNVKQSALQLSNILENLVNISLERRGKIHTNAKKFDLARIIKKNTDIIEEIAAKRIKGFGVTLQPELIVFADEEMIDSVVRNLITYLLDNASNSSIIMIKGDYQEDKARIFFSFEGNALPHTTLKNVIDMNMSEIKNMSLEEKGKSMALILCKDFIKKNRGSIKLVMKDDEKVEISVLLPIQPEDK